MSFATSLKFGEIGESIFFQAHEGELTKECGRKGDFRRTATGDKVELKTDYYCMDKTPNFFFERFSDNAKKSPGGPWQALEHGAEEFCYFYLKNLTYFKFKTRELVEALETIIPKLTPFPVRNATYVTVGYRVPRELLRDVFKEERLSCKRQ